MTDWSEGYMTEIEYIHTYHARLNPAHMCLAVANAGFAPPLVGAACELGFGKGMSLNMHAAASSVAWYGTDFHPGHTAFARGVASLAGSAPHLFNESFAEFCNRADLPDFDFVALHGIWSWISDVNRAVILDFVRRKLKPGGILSISYNTLHRWSSFYPVRDLLTEHSHRMAQPGMSSKSRVSAALDFADRLVEKCPDYFQANRMAASHLEQMKGQQLEYLAGEYFGREWRPMSFAEMAPLLNAGQLSYACSADYGDHIDAICLTRKQQDFLQEIPDELFRQTVRDFCTDQSFRNDYWVKDGKRLNAQERIDKLQRQRVVLVCPPDKKMLNATTADGKPFLTLAQGACVLDALANAQPHALGELARLVQKEGMSFSRLMEFVLLLAARDCLQPAQDVTANSNVSVTGATRRLNQALLQRSSLHADSVEYLASPVTGGGVPVSQLQQLFLFARAQGLSTPQEWARVAFGQLTALGKKVERAVWAERDTTEVLSDLTRRAQAAGRKNPDAFALGTLAFIQEQNFTMAVIKPAWSTSPQDDLNEITAQAQDFAARHLPTLVSLRVA